MTNAPLIIAAKKVGFLTAEQEADLAHRARAGDAKAKERLILAHLPLATKYAAKFKGAADFDDVLSEAMIGLAIAADRYDPDHKAGARFGTVAAYWMKAQVLAFVKRNHSVVKVSESAAHKTAWYGLTKAKAKLGIQTDQLTPEQITAVAKLLQVPEAVVVETERRLRHDTSLNAPIVSNAETHAEYVDFLEDESLVPADDAMIAAEESQATIDTVGAALDKMTQRERVIVERRYLSDDKATLRELADEMGVSYQRVSQIETRAMQRVQEHTARTIEVEKRAPKSKRVSWKGRDERMEFVKRNVHRMTVPEMAKALRVTPTTVRAYMRRMERERGALPLAA